MSRRFLLVSLTAVAIPIFILTACRTNQPVVTTTPAGETASETATPSLEPSQTSIPPTDTPTPVPLAALVNGEAITLQEFQGELSRFQAASIITGTQVASDTNMVVMNEIIDQTLLAQGATETGFVVDEATLQSRISSLINQLGGAQALDDWKAAHGYSDSDFEQALRRAVGAAWMRDQIIREVPETADQVHVIQILLFDKTEADEVYALLQSGTDFQELASTYDPISHGNLGWFPRGYLGDAKIDEAVFGLQPGQYSSIIETDIGYHILFVVERDANHPLQADARIALQVEALKQWLQERRDQSEIQIYLP